MAVEDCIIGTSFRIGTSVLTYVLLVLSDHRRFVEDRCLGHDISAGNILISANLTAEKVHDR